MPDGLSIWTVYDHPLDYPDAYVARRWVIDAKGPGATTDILLDADLSRLRAQMERWNLTRLARQDEDDPKIVEVWL